MSYGVIPSGFSRKPLSVILAELEQANIDQFGPGVYQTAQSPLGQWNGLRADFASLLWELAEDVYQSIDPDQAEGRRLEILANLRLISRRPGETDESLRQAITNVGEANLRDADFVRALYSIEGVTWARVYSNDTSVIDDRNLAPHSVAAAILGGDDAEVGRVIRNYVIPGIGTSGNVSVRTDIDGYCRTVRLIRPVERPVGLWLQVSRHRANNNCPPPSQADIRQVLYDGLTGENRPANGQVIDFHLLRTIISCAYPNVEVQDALAGFLPSSLSVLPLQPEFLELPSFALSNIQVI